MPTGSQGTGPGTGAGGSTGPGGTRPQDNRPSKFLEFDVIWG